MSASDTKTWNFDEYDWIDRYDERMRRLKRLCYDETLSLLPEHARAKAGDRVLDIGTGTGNSAVPFLEKGCIVTGLDPSERMLEHAKEKVKIYAEKFSIQHIDNPFLSIPFVGDTFDIVISAYAIHHLDDRTKQEAIREMKRVLKPEGRIVIADTMFRDAGHKARALADHSDLEDEYHPLLTTFPAVFESEGLKINLYQVGELIWVAAAEGC